MTHVMTLKEFSEARETALEKFGTIQVFFYAWIEMFSNSAGPLETKGIVLHAFTQFQVVAFVDMRDPSGKALMYCNGVWRDLDPKNGLRWYPESKDVNPMEVV